MHLTEVEVQGVKDSLREEHEGYLNLYRSILCHTVKLSFTADSEEAELTGPGPEDRIRTNLAEVRVER